MTTLRPYQTRTRHITNRILNNGGNPLIVMDTGTGKTKADCAIIADRVGLGKRVYVIVPSKEIHSQWLSELAHMNPGYVNDEGMRGKNRSIYVCMMQSLYNNLTRIDETLWPDEIHTDEAHHSSCETLEAIYTFFGKAQRLGMTATPIRTDGKPLGHLYTEIVSEINIQEAIENKYLTPAVVFPPEDYLDNIPMNGTDFDQKFQAELLGDPKIVGDVIETYTNVLCGLPCLVACSTYEHAKMMTEEFNDAGWKAEHIHSKLPDHIRTGMTKRIASGRTNILCTVGIGIEGWDCPGLMGIIWLRRTMSVTIWKQFNGRVMRLQEGKEVCIIIDPMGNTVIHGMPDRVHKWSLTNGEDKDDIDRIPFIKCWSCGTYNNPDNLECHWCGAEIGEGSEPEDGTCRKCANFNKDCFSSQFHDPDCDNFGICNHEAFCPFWLDFPGCPDFKKKSRRLPAIIDGKLVAITTDGQIAEIQERANRKKEEQSLFAEQEEAEKNEAVPLSREQKADVLRDKLFSDGGRRLLFREALGG